MKTYTKYKSKQKHKTITALLIVLVLLVTSTPLLATSQLSVPLGHRVYDVLDSAEIRGLLPKLSTVRPYSTTTIVELLEELYEKPLRNNEKEEVTYLIDQLRGSYTSTESFNDMLATGSYHSYLEEADIYLEVGGKVEFQTTTPLTDRNQSDYRFAVRPYIKSDIKNLVSFSMDVGLRMDKLDSTPFLDNDFTIPGEGFYMDFLAGGSGGDSIPFGQFYAGFDLFPEISTSLWDGLLELRWGAVKRNWGVGTNGLQLAGKASPFEAIEGHLNLASWLRYSFITGSLGGFALKDGIEGNDAFFAQSLHDNQFNNNYSAKRVEIDLPWNITFGIYESNVWVKRFEIGYLNPFTILMLQQSLLGDMDNMLAGIDFQWRLPGLLRVYAALATTEMHEISPSEFFTHYRNIMGFQGGIDIDLPLGQFSKITFQYTKLEPFFYTHYAIPEVETKYKEFDVDDTYTLKDNEYWGDETPGSKTAFKPVMETNLIQTSYVNKGFNLGYPLHPNSDEILVSSRIGFSNSINMFLTMKYQRRSGQYGYTIDRSVNKNYKDMDTLEPKDFIDNLFEKNLSVEIGVSKRFERLPLTVYGSYRFGSMVERGLSSSADGFNDIPNTSWSDASYDHVIQIGFNLYD